MTVLGVLPEGCAPPPPPAATTEKLEKPPSELFRAAAAASLNPPLPLAARTEWRLRSTGDAGALVEARRLISLLR